LTVIQPESGGRPLSEARQGMARAAMRSILSLAVAFGLLALLQGRAAALPARPSGSANGPGWAGGGCGDFSLTQTYRNWGPADSYGRPVTVSYQATRCSRLRPHAVDLSIKGVAVVYRGTSATGSPLDEQQFVATGHWANPSNRAGWPPDWWQCGVRSAEFSWQIVGVYTFAVTVERGVWNLDVQAGNESVDWAYDAC
jgi:hypothetical protein